MGGLTDFRSNKEEGGQLCTVIVTLCSAEAKHAKGGGVLAASGLETPGASGSYPKKVGKKLELSVYLKSRVSVAVENGTRRLCAWCTTCTSEALQLPTCCLQLQEVSGWRAMSGGVGSVGWLPTGCALMLQHLPI